MNAYSAYLAAELAKLDVEVAPSPTGGGCHELATTDGKFGITDGDADLPDGDSFDGVVAVVTKYDDEGGADSELNVYAADAPMAGDVARIAAGWIAANN